ncbi:uncharacterized protein LOC115665665 [Syzygium oleosum]|uniref:uncharacterized protein LOC115665665 n=1 Tax=Syzygium oleosum TaxID=219896 RepID=UPI0024B99B09|nr:uncharacterized protein LOC115665665 [Syzygium oleosum]
MTRSQQGKLTEFDPEIERTFKRRLREQRNHIKKIEGVDDGRNQRRLLKDYATPTVEGTISSIRRPAIQANNFEIKPSLIQMLQQSVQFSGLPSDDPNAHIDAFHEICDTIKYNEVSDDVIRLRLFPFSLRDKAKGWFSSLPVGSITTWNDMAQKFLGKFFPPAKSAKMRNDITNFMQMDNESLYEAWERFKEFLRRCPHHGLPVWMQVQTFYNGCSTNLRSMIDAAAGGTLNNKTPEEAYNLLEEMASNSYQWPTQRIPVRKASGVREVDAFTAIAAQIEALNKKIDNMSVSGMKIQNMTCDFCDGGHVSTECQVGNTFAQSNENANFVGNFNRSQNNPYSNTCNSGWRNYPNFSWNNQNVTRLPPEFKQPEEIKSSLEDIVTKLANTTQDFIKSTDVRFQNQEASIRNLEMQVGQLANMMSGRQQGFLPSNTKKNPIENVKAIILRSGKQVGEEDTKQEISRDKEEEVKKQPKEIGKSKLFPDNFKPYVPLVPFP